MYPIFRAFLVTFAILALGTGAMFATLDNQGAIGFFDLRVLNDTNRPVTIESCWDLNCYNTRGFHPTVIRPGRSAHEDGHFATDAAQSIAVAVGRRSGKWQRFSSCLLTRFAPGQKAGLVRISQARPCLTGPGGSAGGGA